MILYKLRHKQIKGQRDQQEHATTMFDFVCQIMDILNLNPKVLNHEILST